MRSLDFTACIRDCAVNCWRKLTDEEKEWLKYHPNRQSFASFDDCSSYRQQSQARKNFDKAREVVWKELDSRHKK